MFHDITHLELPSEEEMWGGIKDVKCLQFVPCETSIVDTFTKSMFPKLFKDLLGNPKKSDEFVVEGPNPSDISDWMNISF